MKSLSDDLREIADFIESYRGQVLGVSYSNGVIPLYVHVRFDDVALDTLLAAETWTWKRRGDVVDHKSVVGGVEIYAQQSIEEFEAMELRASLV